MNKPQEIVTLESFISEKKNELYKVDDKKSKLKHLRAEVAFKEGKDALKKIDAQIQETILDFEFLETQIEGARRQIKVETNKWIKDEEKRLENEVKDLLKQADKIEIESNKLIASLKELNGQEFLVMWLRGKPKAELMRSEAYSKRDRISDTSREIKEAMGMKSS